MVMNQVSRSRSRMAFVFGCWLLVLAAPCAARDVGAATVSWFCGLTFELTPTAEAGAVSPDCENAGKPQAGLTAPAVAGRGVERGVRRHLRRSQWRIVLSAVRAFVDGGAAFASSCAWSACNSLGDMLAV